MGVVAGAGVAVLTHQAPASAVVFTTVTAVAALLPDLDHPDARLSRSLGWPGQFIAWTIGSLFGHRGITHSVLGVGLLSAGMAFIPRLPPNCYWAVILGCAVHILGDACTVSGVPLFWPKDRRFRMPFTSIRTGQYFETVILTPALTVLSVASVAGMVALTASQLKGTS
jgi:inner membrane protein